MKKISINKVSEQQIQKSICEYLFTLKNCMIWKNNSVGVYDPTRKIFRKSRGPFVRNGVADILGIYHGLPLAIEVKSKTGKVSKDQREFLEEFDRNGGIAIIARSIEDVRIGLSIKDRS